MATNDVTNIQDNDHVIMKPEPFDEALTPDSESLSPEAEDLPNDGSISQEPLPAPKRKGGRKPVRWRLIESFES